MYSTSYMKPLLLYMYTLYTYILEEVSCTLYYGLLDTASESAGCHDNRIETDEHEQITTTENRGVSEAFVLLLCPLD